ncbi:MAG: PilZ domain-containing protein [Spirochaetota bacterium]
MVERILRMLGSDRAFELFEYLILFFVIFSVATLLFVLAYEIRSRRALRRANGRLEEVVRYLGRNLFGEEAWKTLERSVSSNGRKLDSLLGLLDPASFELWARDAIERGVIDSSMADDLRERITQPPDFNRPLISQSDVSECIPVSGMPIAVLQDQVQVRGTIAEVGANTFTVWVLDANDELDSERTASFMLLSRSGPYTFEAPMEKADDGSLVVQRPHRILRNQRRRFRRRPAALSASVKRYLSSDPPDETVINDLSGGGATVMNPNHAYEVGDVLTLAFAIASRHYMVTGRVVRVSGDDHRLHVRFEAMKDQQRQEIAESVALADLS